MSKTLVIPLDEELADANWIGWLAICVDMEAAILDVDSLRQIVGTVSLSQHLDDDRNPDAFVAAATKAFEDAGFTIVHASVGMLAWAGD